MKGNRSFNNLFLSRNEVLESSHSPQFVPSLKESQYFEPNNHFRQQSSVFPYHPLYCDKNVSTQQNSQRISVIYDSQIAGKQSLLLERSRSHIIQPVYLSPYKNTMGDDLDQSRELGTSKASQFTFSKPSEFIINTPKQNVYLDSSKKSFISTHQIANDDYGYTFGHFHPQNPKMKQSVINVASPMRQSYFAQTFNPSRNSTVINPISQIVPQIRKYIQSPTLQSNIFSPKRVPGVQILKNPSLTGFTIRPSIRRCLSNVSIFSQKSQIKLSQTKINFNYISPPKSENKMGRKLSFKKEDVKNPLSKLTKKKEQKIKNQHSPRPKIISEVVNEYFPEFKIKKNKMKSGLSPAVKHVKLNVGKKNDEKSQISDNSERRHTFIASLDALSQLSELKPIQQEELTYNFIETPKKIPQSEYDNLNLESRSNSQPKSISFNKITGYRITLDGQKVPLSSSRKEEIPSNKGSQVSKCSQLSVNSMKNGEETEFMKKHGNDSSHTTDYEDEIVKKIKEDLGLHFSYSKKK